MTCFECGLPAEHSHHVIPRVLGGTKTVPLCAPCHSKIHGIDLGTSELVKIGLKKAKERGVLLGSARPGHWDGREHLRCGHIRKAAEVSRRKRLERSSGVYAQAKIILSAMPTASLREMAEALNGAGIPTATGKGWSAMQVSRILPRKVQCSTSK